MSRNFVRSTAFAVLGLAVSFAAAAVEFRIPPQALDSALLAFSEQANVQVSVSTNTVSGIKTSGVAGDFTPEQALSSLLVNTGLKFTAIGARTYSVTQGATSMLDKKHPGSAAVGSAGDLHLVQSDQAGGKDASADQDAGSTQGPKLEEVVVTAQKREEKLQNVPISISVLRGADLDKSSLSVDEVLNTIPGVQVLSTGEFGTTAVSIRGIGGEVLQGGASPVAYYVDSVPFGLIKSGLAPDMSAYDLNRVEVLRGPQGTLYGANALNGVVRVLTNDADFSRYGLKVRASDSGTDGGGNNYRGDVVANVPIIEGKLAARAVVGYEHDSGWVDAPNKNDVNDENAANYRLKLSARPTDELSIDLSAWRSRLNVGAPSMSDPNQRVSTPEAEPIHTNFDMFGAKVGYRLPHLSITSSTSYLGYKNEGLLDISQQLGDPNGTDFHGGIYPPLLTRDRSDVFSEEVNLASNGLEGWRWSAGGIYRRGTEKLRQALDFFGFDIQINDLSKSYAVFGEVTRLFLDGRWELTAGLRHFHDDISEGSRAVASDPFLPASSTASATTPRVVLTWHPNTDLTVYGSYSEGFRSGFPQNSYAAAAGFAPLQPDKLKNYELGAKGAWLDGRISYDTAVYYMDWRDTQQTLGIPFGPTFATAFVNSESASGMGVDFSLMFKPTTSVTLGVSGSWNDLAVDADLVSNGITIIPKGDRLAQSPKTTAGAWANYVFPIGAGGYKARVEASANYVSALESKFLLADIYDQFGERMLLTQASFAIDSPHGWTLSLYGNNVTNEQGSQTSVPWPDFLPRVRPRTVGLQVTYDFARQ